MDTNTSKPTVGQLLISAITGGAGAIVGYAIMRTLLHSDGPHHWSDVLALVLSAALAAFGVVFCLASRVDSLGKAMGTSEGRPPSPFLKRQFVLQGMTLLLAGVMLGAPPLLAPGLRPHGGWAITVLAAIVGLFAVQSWLNMRLWREADEFYRRVLMESSAASFWGLQGALFLWASAEKLGFAPPLSLWDATAIMMTAYLVISVVVSRRLGADR